MRFDVREDLSEVTRALGGMEKGGRRVIQRATNYAIRRAMTRAVRAVGKQIPGVKQRAIRAAIQQKLATNSRLTASLTPTGRRIPLIDLGARQTQKGITYRSKGGRKLIAGAFIAEPGGARGVFKRKGKPRLPIAQLRGPSIPRAFIQDEVLRAIDDTARADFQREALRQIDLLRTQQGL